MSKIWSTDYCELTCPAVDEAIDVAHDDIRDLVPKKLHGELDSIIYEMMKLVKSHGTEKLRAALEQCCTDLGEANDQLVNADARIRELEHQLKNMETCDE